MRRFRIRDLDTGLWYEGMDEDLDIIWTSSKTDALVLPPEKREFWEDDEDVEIVELAEDEFMAAMGCARLPGF